MPLPKPVIYYYTTPAGSNPIKEFINSFKPQQQVKILRIFQYIQEYGLTIHLPQIKKLTGTPLWEIRILGKQSLRLLYVIPRKNLVLILHGFIKKTAKTPKKELKTALNRYQEWLDR
ncbi:MAG: type II toxin-antitoxin system RelE/ParE family toxin [Patescibacteria group bacterium]|nr:type II toxin-antitoxin system RelE/ParE family toxin [Patescibacteria group bacterium]